MKRELSSVDEHIRELPPPPDHGFVGRRTEIQAAERAVRSRYVVLRAEHGEGKTTLAAELARRMLEDGRVERVAYVSFEIYHDGREARFAIGKQLVPSYELARSQDPRLALQLLERVLQDHRTLLIFDDLEAVLPRTADAATDSRIYEPTVLDQILLLASELNKIENTFLMFASVEPLPEPFHSNEVTLERLEAADSVELIRGVLSSRGANRELADDQARPLIDAVGAHPLSVVALAGEIATSGLSGAVRSLEESEEAIRGLDLIERRRALALGAEIALRSVPAPLRSKLPLLGVFRGGGHLTAIAAVLELDVESDEEVQLAECLIDVGLAQMLPDNYLNFHPSLRAALRAELTGSKLAAARVLWAESTVQLVGFLCQEQIKSPQLAASLTLLDLRNFVACLEYLRETADADQAVELGNMLESLVGPLGRPQALEAIDRIRGRASRHLSEWTHERYLIESSALELLMDAGRPEETAAAARRLLRRAESAGESAYEGATYDLATIHLTLGLALLMSGDAEPAASSLEEARRRFHDLAESGHEEAAKMEAQTMADMGDTMRALDFRQAAFEAYRQAVEIAERRGDRALAAEVTTRIGDLRLRQGRTTEALASYQQAREIFAELDEPRTVAGIWHQIGAVHQSIGQIEEATSAFREALRLEAEEGDRPATAETLGEIGTLQAEAGQLAEAIKSFLRAAEIFAEIDDLAKEGIARSQAADKMLQLGAHDDARRELLRTIECDAPFGHDTEPWRTFSMLARLEKAAGNPTAMRAARERAIEAYLRYRRDGGTSKVGHGEIFAEVTGAIVHGKSADVRAKLEGMLRRRDLPSRLRALIPVLKEVLDGSRDPALAADLYYRDAAELLLQLENLDGARAEASDVYF